ncbi:hypothetical protein KSP39_PZI012944 [Platanthera zijinensis]|uniref:Uncharacterized protein n=1 Tax=Platanthera zijinensis TaxID=2320716 RepID=A0AAP0BDH1_9ASPA
MMDAPLARLGRPGQVARRPRPEETTGGNGDLRRVHALARARVGRSRVGASFARARLIRGRVLGPALLPGCSWVSAARLFGLLPLRVLDRNLSDLT